MRDSHERLPELMRAIEEDGKFFVVVRLEKDGQQRQFRFGVSPNGFATARRIFGLRPFDTMPGVSYRYFFVPSTQRLTDSKAKISIKVEQGRNNKDIDVECDLNLAANLTWFFERDDWSRAEHLAVV